MIRYKSIRLCGIAAMSSLVFLFSSACLVIGVSAQSTESAIAGSSKTSATPSAFLVAPSISLGYAPSSVATGDLRRSGKLDLVTADSSSGSITVFLGVGQGKFAPGVTYEAGSHPSAVLLADINGDGRPDVLVSNESEGTISVLLGSGDGTLQPRQSYAVGFNPSYIVAGDFNGTGHVDVAVAGKSESQLAIFFNAGDGNLQKPVLRRLSKTPTALTVADFNNDGHADIALANTDGTVSILLGRGEGVFHALTDISVASGSLSSIASGDFNQDGKIDLVVTQPGQKSISVLLGDGNGGFASPASYAVGNEPVFAVIADVNGDGIPDLVVINNQSNTFSVLNGTGDGTFKSPLDFVAGNAPLAAVADDFYGSGHVDLAIINQASQTVSVPSGYGDGTFKAARSYFAGQQPVSIASGILDGGKTPGVVVANYCGADPSCSSTGNVAVFLPGSNGVSGSYRLSSTYTLGSGPAAVALADVNGDKNLDIVAVNRLDKTVSVLLGAGDGTFRQLATFPLAASPIAFAIGDLNNDGKPDLAVLEDCGAETCSQTGSVELMAGTGTGAFQSLMTYAADYSPSSIAIGDVNGDKIPDIVVANRCGVDATCQSPGTAIVLLGDGTGKFTPGAALDLGRSPSSIALGNLTGSGLDLIVSSSSDNTVAVMQGNGDGTFKEAVPYAVGKQPGSLVVADFNGDGKADVAVTNFTDSTVSVLYGRGDNTLLPATTLPVGTGPIAMTAIVRASGGRASLATANGNTGAPTLGTEFTAMPAFSGTTDFSTFTLTPGTNPSSLNQPDLLTATITTPPVGPAPTANVVFSAGGTALSDCGGASGVSVTGSGTTYTATCTTSTLPASTGETLTAEFLGDATYTDQTNANTVTQVVGQLSPTLTISPTTAANLNTAVTLTATVGGVTITPIGPTGTVTFSTGGNAITCSNPATEAVSASTGVATCTTSSLPVGTNVITASYSGDSNYSAAPTPVATVNQVINQLTPTLTISPTTAANLNTAVTLTATVGGVTITPTGPTGTVTFSTGGNAIACSSPTTGAVNPSNGVATCTTSSVLAGTDVITASYSGDSNYIAVPAPVATVNQVINKLTPTVTISPTTATNLNTAVTLTATVGGVTITPIGPTGTVTFSTGGNTITCSSPTTGSVNPSTGIATCTTSSLPGGIDVITASYTGDSNYNAVPTPVAMVNQVISKLSPMLTLSPASTTVDTPVTLTATVGGVTFTPNGPTGTVTFSTGGNPIACSSPTTGAVNSTTGVATCTTSALVSPADIVAATYNGDNNYNSAVASQITVSVGTAGATTSFLPSSPTSGAVNQPLTFTVKVAPPGGGGTPNEVIPSGNVTFKQGTTTMCSAVTITGGNSATGTAGTAACTYSFTAAVASPGVTITAAYSGDQNFSSGSGTLSPALIVSPSGTQTNVTSSPTGPVSVNQTVTITATISPTSPGSISPTLPVSFTYTLNGGASTSLCTNVAVNTTGSGASAVTTAVCPFTLPSAGSYVIKAVYPTGDPNFGTSTGTEAMTVNKTVTTTTVVSSLPSAGVNQPVTFTATITPVVTGSTNPTGTVAFTYTPSSGSATALNCTIAQPITVITASGATTAACTASLPANGNYTITATYSGDGNFTGPTSGTVVQPVGLTPTTTAVVSSLSTSFVNELVTFTATVTPSITGSTTPTGSVAFASSLGGRTVILCSSAPLNSTTGIATCASPLPSAGSYSVTATYSGDANFQSSSNSASPLALTVNQPVTTVDLTSSLPASSVVNQPVSFTAVITPAYTGATEPSGTVTFTDTLTNSTLCTTTVSTTGTVPLCVFAFPTAATHTVNATYSGDGNFPKTTSVVDSQVVNQGPTTITVVSSSPSSSVNQVVTFTATVTPTTYSGSTFPTGTVTFSYVLNGSAAVNLSCTATQPVSVSTLGTITTAACTAPLPSQGAYTITAAYSGDKNFQTGSGTATQTVAGSATTTTLIAAPSPSNVNQPVLFTATVKPGVSGSTNPTGTVAFSYVLNGGASVSLCSAAPVTGATGVSTCLESLPTAATSSAPYMITAKYSGDANFTTSSGAVTQAVNPAPLTISVTSSQTPSLVNEPVTFAATLTLANSGSAQPTATVSFKDTLTGSTLCANATLTLNANNAYTASCSPPVTNQWTAATHPITATYNGDPDFPATTSSVFAQVVVAGPTTPVLTSALP
ncbi:MAG: Ig-like domain repeat protein, partial [Terracidiphilus sp.]